MAEKVEKQCDSPEEEKRRQAFRNELREKVNELFERVARLNGDLASVLGLLQSPTSVCACCHDPTIPACMNVRKGV